MSGSRITSVDYRKPYRPFAIGLVNTLGRAAAAAGLGRKISDRETLLRKAAARSGLNDFGDGSFAERMGILIDSLNEEARLHAVGRFMVNQNLMRILGNRLRYHRDLATHPEILAADMEDPVFIVGLQRTGTTMLHRMLASDSINFRYLASWEAINPAPLGEKRNGAEDPRIKMARIAQRALKYLSPDFFAIHPVDALGPEEDCMLFDFDFWSTVPEAMQRVPAFSRWLEDNDHTEAYGYYKKILKYLYWQRPGGRWVLKTPQHMEHFDEIFRVFPGAKIIHTHRDPQRVIASFCSMVSHAYGIFSDHVDPVEIGRHWGDKALKMVNSSISIRDKAKPEQIIDVYYRDLMADPVVEMRKIYGFLGLDFTTEIEHGIANWRSDNPQHRYGKHRYRLEDFGMNEGEVIERFRPYTIRFNIPEEKNEGK